MMKKIISLILIFVLIASAFCAVNAQEAVQLKDQYKSLMSALEFYRDGDDLTEVLTRGQYADLLVRSIYDEPERLIDSNTKFSDVAEDHQYYAPITLLKALEVSLGDGNGNFKPDEEIIVSDAIVLTVRFLGYKAAADKRGYTVVATEKGLYKDFEALNENKLTKKQAFVLLYNALTADISDLQYSEAGIARFMSANRILYKIEGTVTDDGLVSKNGMSEVGAGKIKIEGITFFNETGKTGLFGCEVTGWYKTDDRADYVLIAVLPSSKSSALVLDAGDITAFNNGVYTYYEDETQDDTEEIEIPLNSTIIYNGVTVSYEDRDYEIVYKPVEGNVIFTDSDNDGNYDYVYINNYKTILVSGISTAEKKIYSKYNYDSIELGKANYTITDKDGNKMDFADISVDSVLTVVESLNKEVYTIYVSNQRFIDTIVGVDSSACELYSAEGATYEITDAYARYIVEKTGDLSGMPVKEIAMNYFKLGDVYEIYLDVFGKIAYSEQSSVWSIGFIVNAGSNSRSSLNKDIAVNMYISNTGIISLKLADKVSYFAADSVEGKTISDEQVLEKLENDFDINNKSNYNRLVRYKVNSAREINALELPLNISEAETAAFYGERLTKLTEHGDYRIENNGQGKQGKVMVDKVKGVFYVPGVISSDANQYKTAGVSSLGVEKNNNMTIYTINPDSLSADYIVTSGGTENGAFVRTQVAVVTKIKETYNRNNDTREYVLTLYTNNGKTEKEFTVTEEFVQDAVENVYGTDGKRKGKLSVGDIVYYTHAKNDFNLTGISSVVLIYDADASNGNYGETGRLVGSSGDTVTAFNPIKTVGNTTVADLSTLTPSAPNLADTGWRATIGYLYDINADYITYTTQPLRTAKYNPKLNKHLFTNGSYLTDISPRLPSQYTYLVETIMSDGSIKVENADLNTLNSYTNSGNDCVKAVWLYDWQYFNFVVFVKN